MLLTSALQAFHYFYNTRFFSSFSSSFYFSFRAFLILFIFFWGSVNSIKPD